MSKYRISMNGKTYEMEIELMDEQPVAGAHRGAAIPANPKKAPNNDPVVRVIDPQVDVKTHVNSDTVASPMPGTVVKVLKAAGDEVKEGETVLVLEAMKMENEITAPRAGKIKEIHVAEAQAVAGGVVLFDLEPEG